MKYDSAITRYPRINALRSLVYCLLILLGFNPASSRAQTTYHWTAGSGNWGTATNWSPNGIPGIADSVYIDAVGDYTVTMDVVGEALWLHVGNATNQINLDNTGNDITVGSVFTIDSLATFTTNSASLGIVDHTVEAGDSLLVRGTLDATSAVVNGKITVVPGGFVTLRRVVEINGNVNNHGSVQVVGSWFAGASAVITINGECNNYNSLQLWADHSGTVVANSTVNVSDTLRNFGTLSSIGTAFHNLEAAHRVHAVVNSTGTIDASQRWVSLDLESANHILGGTIIVQDDIEVRIPQAGTAPSILIDATVESEPEGTVSITGGRVDIVSLDMLRGSVSITGNAEIHLLEDFVATDSVFLDLRDASIEGPGSITISGTLELRTATVNTDIIVSDGGRLNLRNTFDHSGQIENSGSIWLLSSWSGAAGGNVAATFSESLANSGTLIFWGDHSGSILATANAVVPDSLVNTGYLGTRGTDISIAHDITSRIVNRGFIDVFQRDLELIHDVGDHVNLDTIRVRTGDQLRFSGGAGFRSEDGSLLQGDGIYDFTALPDGRLITSGAVGPGFSPGAPGVLDVNGSLAFDKSGILEVDIAGYGGGTDFDSLHVSSVLTVGGTLRIHLPDTFDTSIGDTFVVASAGSIVGMFEQIEQPDLGAMHLAVDYGSTQLRVVTLPGGVSIEESADRLPGTFRIGSVYPNPLRGTGHITVDVPVDSEADARFYNLLGQQVAVSEQIRLKAGFNRLIPVNLTNVAPGVYVYRITIDSAGVREVGSLVVVR